MVPMPIGQKLNSNIPHYYANMVNSHFLLDFRSYVSILHKAFCHKNGVWLANVNETCLKSPILCQTDPLKDRDYLLLLKLQINWHFTEILNFIVHIIELGHQPYEMS